MKRILIFIASILAVSTVAWAGVAQAGNVRSGNEVQVKAGEVVDGPLYAGAESIKIAGTIDGDLFCAGQRVEITGKVNGDVLCAAQVLTLKGEVMGDVRIAAMTATLEGAVSGSGTIAGQLVTFEKEATLGRDLTLFAGDVTLAGTFGRDVRAAAEIFTLEGSVGRNVHVREVVTTKLTDTAHVGGNFIYTSESEAEIADAAHVAGNTEKLTPQTSAETTDVSLAGYISGVLFMFSGLALVGFALLGVAPRTLDVVDAALRRKHVWAFGIGLVVVLFTPFIALLALLTGIGVQLAVLVMLIWLALLVGALTFTAYTIGRFIAAKTQWRLRWPRLANMSFGFLALLVLGLIPVVNFVAVIAATIWGVGGVVVAAFEHLHPPKIEAEQAKKKG